MRLALDATYSLGDDLTGVGIYSQEILRGVAERNFPRTIDFLYRPHRFRESLIEGIPLNARRGLLFDFAWKRNRLFHGLNQRLPRRRYCRQLVTFHDLFVMTADYSTSQFRSRFTKQAKHAAEQADAIIAISAFTAEQVQHLLGVEASRIHVVHHGIRKPAGSPAAQREKVVLHVGAVQKRKNLVRLVHAFGALPADWRLVLVGGPGYEYEQVAHAVRSSPAASRITLTGYLSDTEIANWYYRASIFVFPSLDEGFGMPVLEAMAAGLPVIASHRGGLREVCGQAAVLIDPFDEVQLAEELIGMAKDRAKRERYTQAGLARSEEFTWARAVDQTQHVYRLLDVNW